MDFLPPGGRAYILVKKRKLTKAMLNRCNEYKKDKLRLVKKRGWFGGKYYVLYISGKTLINTHMFDGFEWFTEDDIEAELKARYVSK